MENTQLQKNHTPVTYLKPSKGWLSIDLKELWRYRELVYFLTWRDIKVRYKQAVLGIAWAVLQPVLTVLIFTVVFGILLKTPSQDLPYPLFTISALLPWQLFANALQRSSISLVGNANLLTKIYFPDWRSLSAVMAALVDFGVSFCIDWDDGVLSLHARVEYAVAACDYPVCASNRPGCGFVAFSHQCAIS